ncbi:DUF3102 domain-containing protein [Serratia marcescens]|uniref:DUF3102 domain-containing protein n=1 Tax=Serratia marcescens TaxID=615 RepID=UPI0025AA90F7|nr:DUF3102 domain-containing protein [Serratia marcescens]MDN0028177.1 DUF3102 domain-containing protein [Serratia marcescens]
MARPKNNLQVIDSIEGALPQGLEGDLNAINEHRHLIMEQFGEGLPYDRNRIVHEAKFYMAQSAEAMLEAGKRLVILKENEPHGDFEGIVRNQLGIPERTAQRMMQASLKYLSPQLGSKAPTLALLNKTKLFELMTEDDEALAELAEGGTIAGLTLDDVDRMSVRELRQALREKRDEYDVKCRVVAQKDAELNEMKEQKFRNVPADEEISQLRTSLQLMADSLVRETMGAITSGFERLDRDYDERGVPHAGFMAGLLLDFEREIQCLRTRFDLPETREPEVPEWIKPFTDDAQQTLPVDDDADNKQ